jgi:pheromone shutdown protein TraB
MTPKQRKLAHELITNPPPGSDIAAAKEYGIDLTLLVENLDLTVAQRLRKLYSVATFLEKVRRGTGAGQ